MRTKTLLDDYVRPSSSPAEQYHGTNNHLPLSETETSGNTEWHDCLSPGHFSEHSQQPRRVVSHDSSLGASVSPIRDRRRQTRQTRSDLNAHATPFQPFEQSKELVHGQVHNYDTSQTRWNVSRPTSPSFRCYPASPSFNSRETSACSDSRPISPYGNTPYTDPLRHQGPPHCDLPKLRGSKWRWSSTGSLGSRRDIASTKHLYDHRSNHSSPKFAFFDHLRPCDREAQKSSQVDASDGHQQGLLNPYGNTVHAMHQQPHGPPQPQMNPYAQDSVTNGNGTYFQENSFTQPLQYHLYAPMAPHRENLSAYQRAAQDFFISPDLREELQRKSAATLQTLPSEFGVVYLVGAFRLTLCRLELAADRVLPLPSSIRHLESKECNDFWIFQLDI